MVHGDHGTFVYLRLCNEESAFILLFADTAFKPHPSFFPSQTCEPHPVFTLNDNKNPDQSPSFALLSHFELAWGDCAAISLRTQVCSWLVRSVAGPGDST